MNKCPNCPKEYQSENDLERHLKHIHSLNPTVLKQHSEEEKSEFMNQCINLLEKMEEARKNEKQRQ